jgi:hypothetical protein
MALIHRRGATPGAAVVGEDNAALTAMQWLGPVQDRLVSAAPRESTVNGCQTPAVSVNALPPLSAVRQKRAVGQDTASNVLPLESM